MPQEPERPLHPIVAEKKNTSRQIPAAEMAQLERSHAQEEIATLEQRIGNLHKQHGAELRIADDLRAEQRKEYERELKTIRDDTINTVLALVEEKFGLETRAKFEHELDVQRQFAGTAISD